MNDLSKYEPCPDCGRFDNRGVSIDAVIIQDGKILLIRRGVEPFKGFWGTPGGYVKWNQSVEDTVVFEVREETGMTVTDMKLVGIYSEPSRHPRQVINVVYLVQVADGEPVAGDDAEVAQWFSLDALPEKMAFDHAANIKTAQRLL